ncbi:MAG: aminodeoxychorismate/anthranilate synthase component II [Deltaproteobacteria bacterium]|nr:aminodeoxychorismate/anthranilate synthase component II [Deltaproteobacteria bacterium]
MILMIDNYDSFTYNLVQYIARLEKDLLVRRNDEITLSEIRALAPDLIFLSPGPCSPKEAGITVEVIQEFASSIPLMGVCLGHQAIGYAFGAPVVRADRIMHGKTCPIHHDGRTIFQGLPNPFVATRYHSLIVEKKDLPDCLEISAWTDQGEIMGLRHRNSRVEGVQFHPESILTPEGDRLIKNFIDLYGYGRG